MHQQWLILHQVVIIKDSILEQLIILDSFNSSHNENYPITSRIQYLWWAKGISSSGVIDQWYRVRVTKHREDAPIAHRIDSRIWLRARWVISLRSQGSVLWTRSPVFPQARFLLVKLQVCSQALLSDELVTMKTTRGLGTSLLYTQQIRKSIL